VRQADTRAPYRELRRDLRSLRFQSILALRKTSRNVESKHPDDNKRSFNSSGKSRADASGSAPRFGPRMRFVM
jgi:hypothetical protein